MSHTMPRAATQAGALSQFRHPARYCICRQVLCLGRGFPGLADRERLHALLVPDQCGTRLSLPNQPPEKRRLEQHVQPHACSLHVRGAQLAAHVLIVRDCDSLRCTAPPLRCPSGRLIFLQRYSFHEAILGSRNSS